MDEAIYLSDEIHFLEFTSAVPFVLSCSFSVLTLILRSILGGWQMLW